MGLKQIRTGFWGRNSARSLAAAAALLVAYGVSHLLPPNAPPVASDQQQTQQIGTTSEQNASSSVASIPVAGLPVQGRQVMALIQQGGPFPYDKDGSVFGNRERLLPRATRGYYREYTVTTPGLNHRGAKRIVCGGEQPRKPDACYYTDDHYDSFKLIVQ